MEQGNYVVAQLEQYLRKGHSADVKIWKQKKVEAMLNEMDFLRRQAIELSQGLLGC